MAGSSRSLSLWLRSAKVRHAFAVSSVVLATGGLVLARAPSPGGGISFPAAGSNAVSFAGPGAHGTLALSHRSVLAGTPTSVFAELKITADAVEGRVAHASTSLAVVLDTSGSMSGEKIEDARQSILKLLDRMQDDDEIALIRYADASEVIQPLARVGLVRSSLQDRIRRLDVGGGTNIPGGLSGGLRALDEAARGRVKRIVLVSDGLDNTRTQAESLARSSAGNGITVSSLGIGLDFDESYMGGVAQSGHGNFAFLKDGGNMAKFLERELDQTALTTVENATVRLELPRGMRLVSASGAEASSNGEAIELRLGALFAGDERRVIVELASDGDGGEVNATATWQRVGGTAQTARIPMLEVTSSSSVADVQRGRDGVVLASATSVLASKRQLEANEAYAKGDVATATRLAAQNEIALGVAARAAPAAAPALAAQSSNYTAQKRAFGAVAPSSNEGKAAAKSGAMKDLENMKRAESF